ncbi:hypothetical protein [Nocardia sp. NBC_00403]|uniref:hypothetical protein n=1 Tax=Nocardia sp. NBC_00403 TaxID=2975990 RepID=UPI002E23A950
MAPGIDLRNRPLTVSHAFSLTPFYSSWPGAKVSQSPGVMGSLAAISGTNDSSHAEVRFPTGTYHRQSRYPRDALVSEEERQRVAIGRQYPASTGAPRRTEITTDRSAVLVLSTDGDTPDELVRCGEVLSTVLLECTLAGFATCPLTHLTEVPRSRAVIRGLIGRTQLPQAMVRVGTRPESAGNDPATPRRPFAEILDMPESTEQAH